MYGKYWLQSLGRGSKPKSQRIKDRGLRGADRRSEWSYLTRHRRGRGRGRGRDSHRSQISLISSTAYPLPGMPRTQPRSQHNSLSSLEGQLSLIQNRRIKRPANKTQPTNTCDNKSVHTIDIASQSNIESWGLLKKERSGSTTNKNPVRNRKNRTGSRSATGQRTADQSDSLSDSIGSQNNIIPNVTLTTT